MYGSLTHMRPPTPPDNIFASHDREKRRLYEERVREVEGACFTPLVFACTGAAGKTSHVFLKRLASLVSEKRNLTYAETMGWLRCRLAFALVRASVLCLRGTRVKEVRCSFNEFSKPIRFCSNLVETFFNPFPIGKCKKNSCWFSRRRWSKFLWLHAQFCSGFFY